MLSELGTSCHGKTATRKGCTKMLVTGGGGETMRRDFLPWKCSLKAFTKQPREMSYPAPSPAPLALCSGGNEGTHCSGVTHEWGGCSPTSRRETQSPGVHWTRQSTATTSRSLLWRWSVGAGQTLPGEPSFLLGSLAKQSAEKQQMHSHSSKHKTPLGRGCAELSHVPQPHHVHAAELHLHTSL